MRRNYFGGVNMSEGDPSTMPMKKAKRDYESMDEMTMDEMPEPSWFTEIEQSITDFQDELQSESIPDELRLAFEALSPYSESNLSNFTPEQKTWIEIIRKIDKGKAGKNELEAMKKILENGGDPDFTIDGSDALYTAAGYPLDKYAVIVKLLLDNGATNRKFALNRAVQSGNENIVKLLLKRGEYTSLLYALQYPVGYYTDQSLIEAVKYNKENIVKLLLESVDINKLKAGEALVEAAKVGNENIVKMLLESGVNPSDTTALIAAIEYGNENIAEMLLESGVDPNVTNGFGDTSLIKAVVYGKDNILKMLLDKGADPNIDNSNGDTALILAAKRYDKNIVQMLLDKNADLNIKNAKGETAWSFTNGSHGRINRLGDMFRRTHRHFPRPR
jgi:ankyrin repeat protein